MDKLEYIPGDLVMVKESALRFAKDKIFKVISSLSGGAIHYYATLYIKVSNVCDNSSVSGYLG